VKKPASVVVKPVQQEELPPPQPQITTVPPETDFNEPSIY
jgi:hypothetical protein